MDTLKEAGSPLDAVVVLPEEEDNPSQIVFHGQAGAGEGGVAGAGVNAAAGEGVSLLPSAPSAAALKQEVRGGTLAKLVERMTFHRQPEPALTRAFLLTYRSFTDPQTLLEMLVQRFNIAAPPGLSEAAASAFKATRVIPIRLRVFNSLKIWINMSPHEFTSSDALVKQLETFLEKTMAPTLPTAAKSLRKMLDAILDRSGNMLEDRRRSSLAVGSASCAARSAFHTLHMPESRLPAAPLPPPGELDLLQLDPTEVARQMTLLDWEYFRAIQPRECLDQCWTKPETAAFEAPNLLAMIERANDISYWATMTVLGGDNKKERANSLVFFIKLIERFRTMNNFHGAMAVHAGLSNSAGGWSGTRGAVRSAPFALCVAAQPLWTSLPCRMQVDAYRCGTSCSASTQAHVGQAEGHQPRKNCSVCEAERASQRQPELQVCH